MAELLQTEYGRDIFVILIDAKNKHIHNCIHPRDEKEYTRFIKHHRTLNPDLVQVIVDGDGEVKVVPLV